MLTERETKAKQYLHEIRCNDIRVLIKKSIMIVPNRGPNALIYHGFTTVDTSGRVVYACVPKELSDEAIIELGYFEFTGLLSDAVKELAIKGIKPIKK